MSPFSAELPLNVLISWSHALKHGLDAGLAPQRVLKQQARSGPKKGRDLAADLAGRVADGEALTDALNAHARQFPTLFRELVAVGEQSGRLTETFAVLERHYEASRDARNRLLRSLTWPAFMYVSAVAVVTLLLLVMGLMPGGFDPVGLGLTGPGGAFVFLLIVGGGTVGALVTGLKLWAEPAVRAAIEAKLILLPGIGDVFRSMALERFSVALWMGQEAGLTADRAARLSFAAAANDAYGAHAERVARAVGGGEEWHAALESCGRVLFPDDFLDAVAAGEEGGRLAEEMERLSKRLAEESARRLQWAAIILGGAVYALVGLMVVGVIFRMVMAIGGIYNDAMKGL